MENQNVLSACVSTYKLLRTLVVKSSFFVKFLLIFFLVSFSVTSKVHAQVDLLVTTEPTSDGNLKLDSIKTGKNFIFVIDYSVSSLTQNGNNVVIKVQLPPNLNVASGSTSIAYDRSQISSVTNSNGVITATCINPLPAGSTGQMQISMYYTNGSTPNGYNPNIITTIAATNATKSPVSDTTDIVAQASNSIALTKTAHSYATNPTVDGPFTYDIAYSNSGGSEGNLNFYNASIVDTLPVGVVFVGATKFGSIAPTATVVAGVGTIVTWNFGSTALTGSGSASITVKYTSPTYDTTSSFNNCATLIGKIPVMPFVSGTASLADAPAIRACASGHLISNKSTINNSGSGVTSNIPGLCPGTVMAGSSANFKTGWTNSGNTNLDYVEVISNIDPNIDVTAVYAKKVSNPVPGASTPDLLVYEYYELNTNPGVFVPVSGSPFNNTSLASSYPVTLSAGQYITRVKIRVQPGADAIGPYFSQDLTYTGTIRTATQGANGGGTIVQGSNNPGSCSVTSAGTQINNCYTLAAQANGANALTANPSCGNSKIVGQAPVFSSLSKSAANGTSFGPAQQVDYEISAKQLGIGTAQNVTWTDVLDSRLTFIPGSAQFKLNSSGTYAPMPASNVVVSGQTLTFKLDPVDSGSQVFVKFSVMIADGTAPSTITNKATLASTNSYINAGNPNTNSPSITVVSAAAYTSKLGQTGCDTSHFVYYPENAHATPQGKIQYKAVLKNTGNVGGNSITLIDVFPYIGDSRGSQYFANLSAPISFNDPSSTVYYDTVSNPCMPEFNPASNPAGCKTANWSKIPPADITSVKAIKITRSATLAPLDSLVYTWPMILPVGVPSNIVMYNSYTYQLRRTDNAAQLLPATPNKVGMVTDCISPLGSLGNYAWVDSNANGLQDEAVAAGINGLKIYLYKPGPSNVVGGSDQVLLDSTFTANDFNGRPGYYTFTNLPTGDYYVKFPSIPGMVFTKADQTDKVDGNSDANRTTGYSELVHIDALSTGLNKDNPTIDAGYIICTLNASKNKNNISCNNYNDGQITLSVTGNKGAVSYLWNDGTTTKDRQFLAAGNYSVVVTDSIGCSKTLVDSIINPAPLGTISSNKPYLCVDSTLKLSISTPGGKWYINDTTLGKIDSINGSLKGTGSGTAIITYKVSNNPNCGTAYFYLTIGVCNANGIVNGGGSGGLESKSLGDAVAKRMYNKAVNNQLGAVDYGKLPSPQVQTGNIRTFGSGGLLKLSDILPAQLTNNSLHYTSYITTPTDIPSITNATDVYSIDYTLNNEAKAVSFATLTSGGVYDHTKAICDRLKGSVLTDMQNIMVNGMKMISYTLKTPQGNTEYAMSFVVGAKNGRNSYVVQSTWLNEDYTSDETMYNIQLWAISADIVANMASQILSRFGSDKPLQLQPGKALPQTYITAGNRDKTQLNLSVNNKQTVTSGYFIIQDRLNENAATVTSRTVPFTVTANGLSNISVPMGDTYESTISLYINNQLQDEVFMADGSWSYGTGPNTTVYNFNVTNDASRTYTSDEYPVFRNVQLLGNTADFISVFKLLKGGGSPVDLSGYKSLKFTSNAGMNIRITLVKNSIANWSDQYTTVVTVDKGTKEYTVPISAFQSSGSSDKLNANDVTTVMFAMESGTGRSTAVNAVLQSVSFTKQDAGGGSSSSSVAKEIRLYPNPIVGSSFSCTFRSDKDMLLNVRVLEVSTGKVAVTQQVKAIVGDNKITVDMGKTTSAGVYVLSIDGDGVQYNPTRFVLGKK